MRTKSEKTGGYTVYAVSGTNTISFAIDFTDANTTGLLGFAVERIDVKKGERKFLDGYKVFRELIPKPTEDTVANTYQYPIQSFSWDDFTCSPGYQYSYLFYPLYGIPTNIERNRKPIEISITTEPLFSKNEHDIFFNRGVASSQAYRRKFFNLPPDEIKNPELKQKALDWLSRELDEAIIKFIDRCQDQDILLCCFYEFRYKPVIEAIKQAVDRGVNVKIIFDAKDNSYTDEDNKHHDAFPREENYKVITNIGLPQAILFPREAKPSDIQHNKFMVFQKKGAVKASEIWSGSTNLSTGGIHGQTNVGHWVRNKKVAEDFKAYWELLSNDPGASPGDDKITSSKKNDLLKKEVEKISPTPKINAVDDIPVGITSIFSPRKGSSILDSYMKIFDSPGNLGCITLAFGINAGFKELLNDNTSDDALLFMLLEKEDKAKKNSTKPFLAINAKQNVYKAWGNYINENLYQWARETNARLLDLNLHVSYIHSKFLLADPLGENPVVITGSANFSTASTNNNDENMLIIKGDKRVADIYFTEFNRLFNHYYFRSVYNKLKDKKKNSTNPNTLSDNQQSIFLSPDDTWVEKYQPGKLKFKKIEMFTKMHL